MGRSPSDRGPGAPAGPPGAGSPPKSRGGCIFLVIAVGALMVLAAIVSMLPKGDGSGTREREPAWVVEREAREKPAWGSPVSSTQPDRKGDLEQQEAMVLVARLAAENPLAKTVTVTGSIVSSIDGNHCDATWEYDRADGSFLYRQQERETGSVTEYRYIVVTDQILAGIAAKAAHESVDHSSLGDEYCPWELAKDGKVVLKGCRVPEETAPKERRGRR